MRLKRESFGDLGMPEEKARIENAVIHVLSNAMEIDAGAIRRESNLRDDLGLDSFGAIQILFDLEEKYGIEIEDENLVKFKTVGDVVDFIEKRIEDLPQEI